MAVLKIARMGHPILKQRAEPVSDPKSYEIQRLILDMLETLEDSGGIGLAAPQVYQSKRVVIYSVPVERMKMEKMNKKEDIIENNDGKTLGIPLTILINPLIEPLGEEQELGPEACLSVPGLMGEVPRWQRIRLRALDAEGRKFERIAEGFHARVLQHECDHLDGILYPQRMVDLSKLSFVEETRRFSASPVDVEE